MGSIVPTDSDDTTTKPWNTYFQVFFKKYNSPISMQHDVLQYNNNNNDDDEK